MRRILITVLYGCIVTNSVTAQIHDHITGSLRSLNMSFDFVTRPVPHQTSTVNYTFEVTEAAGKDLNILVDVPSPVYVRLLTERIITLRGPLQVGDIVQGVIEFVPLVSGLGTMDISVLPRGIGSKSIQLSWCLDEDGTLHYLGFPDSQPAVHLDPPSHIPIPGPLNIKSPEGVLPIERKVYNPSKCCVTRSTFFTEDSVVLVGDPIVGDLFQFRVLIEPAFSVGDTSIMTYRLKFKANAPDGLDMYVVANGFTIVDAPEAVDYAVQPNQVVDLVMKVVPMAAGQLQDLMLHVKASNEGAPGSRALGERIILRTIFNDDGSLRYLHNNQWGVLDPSKLPETFEPFDKSKHRSRVVIRRDSK